MFKFSLEIVLKQRRIREEQAVAKLAEVKRRRQSQEERLIDLRRRQVDTARQAEEQGALGLSAAEFELIRFQEVKLLGEIKAAGAVLAALQKESEQAEAELVERVKERKLLEKVRERHFQLWQEENNARERREIDEVAVIRAARKEKK